MAIKYAILGLLHYKDMHGYQIKKHIERNFGYMWSINYGQIYPNLKHLADEGLVTMREYNRAGKKGPQRKLYSLTEAGRRAFSLWLGDNPEKNMILRDPFLMRFVFYGFGERERSLEVIDDQIKLWSKLLSKRRENIKRWRGHDLHVRLIAELGLDLNRMLLEWLQKAKREITQADDGQITAVTAVRTNKREGNDPSKTGESDQ
jgi:DNA-binding PadR family transcriptional regulator